MYKLKRFYRERYVRLYSIGTGFQVFVHCDSYIFDASVHVMFIPYTVTAGFTFF